MAERRTGSRSSAAQSRTGSSARGGSTLDRKASAARSTAASRRATTQRRRKARGRQETKASGRAASRPAERGDLSGKSVAELRDALARGIITPLNLVMLTRDRIEEVVGDAVSRGRMTADDAQDLVQGLLARGRKQTNDVLSDLEQLLGRGRNELESRSEDARRRSSGAAGRARRQVGQATARARSRAARTADPVLAQADRARRAAGVGPSFPISGYDDLSTSEVQTRIGDLTPAELRKVRDYEKRHGNRKTILNAVDAKLG